MHKATLKLSDTIFALSARKDENSCPIALALRQAGVVAPKVNKASITFGPRFSRRRLSFSRAVKDPTAYSEKTTKTLLSLYIIMKCWDAGLLDKKGNMRLGKNKNPVAKIKRTFQLNLDEAYALGQTKMSVRKRANTRMHNRMHKIIHAYKTPAPRKQMIDEIRGKDLRTLALEV